MRTGFGKVLFEGDPYNLNLNLNHSGGASIAVAEGKAL